MQALQNIRLRLSTQAAADVHMERLVTKLRGSWTTHDEVRALVDFHRDRFDQLQATERQGRAILQQVTDERKATQRQYHYWSRVARRLAK